MTSLAVGLSIGSLRYAPSMDDDALAYIEAVETADGEALEVGVKTAISSFVAGCKADGIWADMQASCLMAGPRTYLGALVPLKGTAPTNYFFGAGDYNRETGLDGAANKYLDSGRSNTADGQNDRHLAVWLSSIVSPTINNYYYAGCGAGGVGSSAVGCFNTSGALVRCASEDANFLVSPSTSLGLFGYSRSSAAGYTARINGTDEAVTQASQAPFNANVGVFRDMSFGASFANARMAFYSIGGALDLSKLDSRVSAYMIAIAGAIA